MEEWEKPKTNQRWQRKIIFTTGIHSSMKVSKFSKFSQGEKILKKHQRFDFIEKSTRRISKKEQKQHLKVNNDWKNKQLQKLKTLKKLKKRNI